MRTEVLEATGHSESAWLRSPGGRFERCLRQVPGAGIEVLMAGVDEPGSQRRAVIAATCGDCRGHCCSPGWGWWHSDCREQAERTSSGRSAARSGYVALPGVERNLGAERPVGRHRRVGFSGFVNALPVRSASVINTHVPGRLRKVADQREATRCGARIMVRQLSMVR